MIVKAVDIDLHRCAAWKPQGITIAGRENATPGSELDAWRKPERLYAAQDGRLYVVDQQNNRVMRYTMKSGRTGVQIGDGAGSGPRQMREPTSVVVDEAINALYISDYGNRRVQRWSEEGPIQHPLYHFVSSFGSFAEDIQLDPQSNDTLYVLNIWRLEVWTIGPSTKHRKTFDENLHRALSFHVDAGRSVYVAECDSNQIWK